MGSLGLTRAGTGVLPVLQRAWGNAVEANLQAHEDKLEALGEVAQGVAVGIEGATMRASIGLRTPVIVICASAVACALFTGGLFVVHLLSLFRPIAEVIR